MTISIKERSKERTDSVFVMKLKEQMTLHDVNQVDIANTLGYSPQYVSDVLNGRRDPFNIKSILILANTYRFDRKELLLGRVWTLKRIEVPHFATYKQVERALGLVMNGG